MAKRDVKGAVLLLVAFAAAAVVHGAEEEPYSPKMEECVREVVSDAKNKAILPGLIRILFHDAFVRVRMLLNLGSRSGGSSLQTHSLLYLYIRIRYITGSTVNYMLKNSSKLMIKYLSPVIIS
jgi:hypothetical protein